MFKKYLLNTSGNFSIMFAVGAAVLLLGVGAAIDISGATSQRTHLQDLTDAAVLAAVTSGEEKPGQLKKIVAEALAGRRIPGIMDVDCGEEVLELTHDLNTVKARINSLTASENTYIPVGLVNGWRMLEANKPFDEFSNSDKKRKRTLIFMTDGFNTLSLEDPYFDGSHTGSDANEANTLTRTLCNNIKGSGIDIWSVAYNFEGADTKQLLRECATHSGQFFEADNQAELIEAFENIGQSLFSVRLTR